MYISVLARHEYGFLTSVLTFQVEELYHLLKFIKILHPLQRPSKQCEKHSCTVPKEKTPMNAMFKFTNEVFISKFSE